MIGFGLRLRRVQDDDVLMAFSQGYSGAVAARTRGALKIGVELGYLRASHVVGVFDREQRLVAGYVIATRQPLRLLDFVPEPERGRLDPPPGASWEDCCEITCFWRLPEVSPVFMAIGVWPRVIADAIATKKRFIIGFNQIERLDALYSQARTGVTLYAGPSTAGRPARLSAHATEGLWRRVAFVIVAQAFRRALRAKK